MALAAARGWQSIAAGCRTAAPYRSHGGHRFLWLIALERQSGPSPNPLGTPHSVDSAYAGPGQAHHRHFELAP